ncbi:MAG: FmdB family zinc ribbon protein [Planctomycetota bacterium]
MPTYDYVCEECGHAFAEFHSMSQDPLVTCPSCEKDALRRLIGAGAGIIFKGSGFYETDYKRSRGGKSDGGDSKSDSKSSESKSDSSSSSDSKKSESKSESKPSKSSD